MNQTSTLPDFTNPPVIETVLGVQFAPLPLLVPHYGLYWSKIRARFPETETQPPLGQVVEHFGTPLSPPTVGIELLTQPEVRCWFIDESRTGLIQLQRDRFLQNWRKVTGDEAYPRYRTLRPRFTEEWQNFCQFLQEQGLGAPDVNQCEVTYINHLETGRGWQSFGEVSKVVRAWSGSVVGDFLPEPEMVHLDVRYLMADKRGRLHVTLQPALRRTDMKLVLQLSLIARGRPHSSRLEDILDWFDTGHEWIVRGFADFTPATMHDIWGRTS